MKNLILICLSVVFGLLIVEIGLRLFGPVQLQPHISQDLANVPLGNSPFYFCRGGPAQLVAHRVVHAREVPDQTYFEFLNDQVSLIETNEHGFRGEFDPGAVERRVIVLGDSFIRGTLADETETIPALLSRWSPDTHFVNLGTGGHGTMQHVLTYREFKNAVPHEIVLLFVFNGNDLADNLDFKAWLDNPQAHSREPTIAQKVKQTLVNFHIGKLLQRAKGAYVDGPRYSSNVTDEEKELLNGSLAALSRMASNEGKRLFVFSLPEASEFRDDTRSIRKDAVGYGDAVRALLQQSARDNDFTYLDLKSALEDASREMGVPTRDLFGNPDFHLREVGNFAAARAAAKLLQQKEAMAFAPDARFIDRSRFEPSNVTCP